MANQVYANNMEVSCKKAAGKSICAFPDVCFTPPQTPATPPGVPIPYPNTGMASDCTSGSTTVKISGQEVMLKNKSHFKKSTGDEAGCAPKKGVVTSKNMGKVYFTAWSMDVKVEGENVVRHFDLTTHNHASQGPNTPPWMHIDEMAVAVQEACADEISSAAGACKGKSPAACGPECTKAQKCLFVPKDKDKQRCCSPANTGHHLIEDHWVLGSAAFPAYQPVAGARKPYSAAPTVCVEGGRFDKEHGEMHAAQGLIEESYMAGGSNATKSWDYAAGKSAALTAHDMVFGDSDCSHECMKAQLDSFYGEGESRALNPPSTQSLPLDTPANVGKGRLTRPTAASQMSPLLGGS
jgi:Domain of unknown function (DUF4150)